MKPTAPLPILALLALLAVAPARAQVPGILNYQGRVTVGGTNLTTNAAQFKFALVNSNGTAVYWKNDGTTTTNEPSSAVSVAVTQGLYSTLLGDTSLGNMATLPSSVFTNTNVNLRVWFRAGGTNAFLRLVPDQRIGAAGYALRAAAADNASTTNAPGNFAVAGILTASQIVGGSGALANGSRSVVAGGLNNQATNTGSAVLGGEANKSWGLHSFIGAGTNNQAAGTHSVVAGGANNVALPAAVGGAIGGGEGNQVANFYTVVGGGFFNQANGDTATVAGGQQNIASGDYSSVGGGSNNLAGGLFATIPGGTRGIATNAGAFVWSGVDSVETVSTNNNSFTVRAPGGARFLSTTNTNAFVGVILTNAATSWASLSDSNSKTDFEPVEARQILSKVAAMPVTSWHYKHDLKRRYIGPMAQDFHAAFGLGSDDKTISTLDSDGVMYAAIQGLVEELKERDKTIDELKSKLEAVEQRLNGLPPAP